MATPSTKGRLETTERTVRRRPGGRSARVRTAVLSATTEILAQRGYDDLSYEEVADRADVHRTTLYRWWPTKADLVLDAMLTRAGSVVQMRHTHDLEADVLAFLRAVVRHVTSPLGRAVLIATRVPTEMRRPMSCASGSGTNASRLLPHGSNTRSATENFPPTPTQPY